MIVMPELSEWDSFYVIVGSAAGALIGLQFVVMTLIDQRRLKRGAEAGAAFASPTVVHFGFVLFLAAFLRAPWKTIASAAALWGILGFGGLIYAIVVGRRMRSQAAYQPQFEDWLFHLVLPLAAYGLIVLSAFAASSHMRGALFTVAGGTLLLLFTGIHNAWDGIVYHVLESRANAKPERRQDEASEPVQFSTKETP